MKVSVDVHMDDDWRVVDDVVVQVLQVSSAESQTLDSCNEFSLFPEMLFLTGGLHEVNGLHLNGSTAFKSVPLSFEEVQTSLALSVVLSRLFRPDFAVTEETEGLGRRRSVNVTNRTVISLPRYVVDDRQVRPTSHWALFMTHNSRSPQKESLTSSCPDSLPSLPNFYLLFTVHTVVVLRVIFKAAMWTLD